jgi:hypothetical protein
MQKISCSATKQPQQLILWLTGFSKTMEMVEKMVSAEGIEPSTY